MISCELTTEQKIIQSTVEFAHSELPQTRRLDDECCIDAGVLDLLWSCLLSAVVLSTALFSVPNTPPVAQERARGLAGFLPLSPFYLLIVRIFAAVFTSAVQLAFLLVGDRVTNPAVQSWVIATSSACCAVGAWAYARCDPPPSRRADGCPGLRDRGAGSRRAGPYLAGFMYTAIYLGNFANPVIITLVRACFGIHGAFLAVSAVLAAAAARAATRHVLMRRPSAHA